jgi:hypothetical protein
MSPRISQTCSSSSSRENTRPDRRAGAGAACTRAAAAGSARGDPDGRAGDGGDDLEAGAAQVELEQASHLALVLDDDHAAIHIRAYGWSCSRVTRL